MRPNIWGLLEPYVSECKECLAFKHEYCRLMQRTVHEGEGPDAVLSSHVCTLENLAEAHINLHEEKLEAEAQLDYDRFQREYTHTHTHTHTHNTRNTHIHFMPPRSGALL